MAEITPINPATEEAIGAVNVSSKEDVHQAVKDAREAFPAWRAFSFEERAEYLKKVRDYFKEHKEELAEVLHREQGKPMSEALGEAGGAYSRAVEHLEVSEIITEEIIPSGCAPGNTKIVKEPRGIVAVISPWNFPLTNPLNSIIPALLAGNTVIFKPSEVTALCGIEMDKAFQSAGFPKGVFTTLQGAGDVGAELVKADINMVSFTGSVATGKKIMENSAQGLHALSLELGGKDPALVLEDADLEKAVEGIVGGAFFNTGQVCCAIERVYVHEKLYNEFVEAAVEKVNAMKKSEDYGPLVREEQRKIVEAHVEEAKSKGAKALAGGKRIEGKGFWYEPTVLIDVTHNMKIMKEETFGPVMPIMKFGTVEEAIALANDSKYGLGASVWTKDTKKGAMLARRIDAGTIGVNRPGDPCSGCPWGGVKESGIGRVRGKEGLLEFTVSKVIAVNEGKGNC